ncbi:hypothetical protein GW782_01260 [bacterium]|nr:hypothetical protein [archaeon]NCS98363.1 hypothetical protein [archaeon]OIP20266.1 MAG: hypothetical protein AUJ91_01705 [archaeon CG2_30_31_98]
MERVKKAIEEGRAQFGAKQSIEAMKNRNAEIVVVAKDSPEFKSAQYYQQAGGVEIITLDRSEDIRTFCKKPFKISMLVVLKTKKANKADKDEK